jgi:ubiquinone/menaquinone biosynthesis C-methylase UbiE
MKSANDAGPSPTISASDTLFAGSIPEIYDRYLVPLIFESYACDLADRVARVRSQRVLEIAAGTGALTRALALRLPAHARIVATDINQSMLAYAAQRSPPGDDRITRRPANALALPFEAGAFDVVACQFGVMFFPDKAQGYREAHRVLKPGGHFSFNVWDHIAVNEFADVVTQALATVFLEDPPLFLPRIPHGYHDVGKIKEELDATGFTSISVETRDDTSKGRSPRDVAIAYCQGTPLRNEIEARDASRLEEVTQTVGDLLARRFGSGPIEGRVRAHVITAIR